MATCAHRKGGRERQNRTLKSVSKSRMRLYRGCIWLSSRQVARSWALRYRKRRQAGQTDDRASAGPPRRRSTGRCCRLGQAHKLTEARTAARSGIAGFRRGQGPCWRVRASSGGCKGRSGARPNKDARRRRLSSDTASREIELGGSRTPVQGRDQSELGQAGECMTSTSAMYSICSTASLTEVRPSLPIASLPR